MLVGLVIGAVYLTRTPPVAVISPVPSVAKPEQALPVAVKKFVGAVACRECHQAEFKAWQGSDHDLAMQDANAQTMLGDFDNAKLNMIMSTRPSSSATANSWYAPTGRMAH